MFYKPLLIRGIPCIPLFLIPRSRLIPTAAAHQPYHHALDDQLCGGNQVREAGILGFQEALLLFDDVAFERGFPVDQGGYDVAIARFAVLKDDVIPIDDVGLDHGISANSQSEGVLALARQAEGLGIDGEGAFGGLAVGFRHARCDPAENGNFDEMVAGGGEFWERIAEAFENDGPGFAREALDDPLFLQGAEMADRSGLAGKSEVFLNLARGRHDAGIAMVFAQVVEKFLLAACKHMVTCSHEQCKFRQSLQEISWKKGHVIRAWSTGVA